MSMAVPMDTIKAGMGGKPQYTDPGSAGGGLEPTTRLRPHTLACHRLDLTTADPLLN